MAKAISISLGMSNERVSKCNLLQFGKIIQSYQFFTSENKFCIKLKYAVYCSS